MKHRPLVSALLAFALLVGQGTAAAHDDSDHGLQLGSAHCVVCVYAHGAGHGALPLPPALPLAGAAEAPEAFLAATQVAVTVRLHPIRGPPALLS